MMEKIKHRVLSGGRAVFSFALRFLRSVNLYFRKTALQNKILRNILQGETKVDERRRAFIKYAAFGTAVFLAGKYINPLINAIRGDTVLSEKIFENFKITETGKKLLVTDDEGDEILTIDKESF